MAPKKPRDSVRHFRTTLSKAGPSSYDRQNTMKNFVSIKLALLPFTICWALLLYTTPCMALAAGLIVSGILFLVFRQGHTGLDRAGIAILTGLNLGLKVWPTFVSNHVAELSLICVGLYCLGTVCLGKPWTADFSRRQRPDLATHPIFQTINMLISAAWGVLFIVLGTLHASHARPLWTLATVAVGLALSTVGPSFLRNRLLQRQVK
jgi:hypothetical protein